MRSKFFKLNGKLFRVDRTPDGDIKGFRLEDGKWVPDGNVAEIEFAGEPTVALTSCRPSTRDFYHNRP